MEQINEAALFAENGYVECKEFLPGGFIEIIKHYMMIKHNTGGMEVSNKDFEGAIQCYGDAFLDSMLVSFIPYVENVVGKSIVPSYSFARIYKAGQVLPLHCDRPSCQYSTTLHVGVEEQEERPDYKWPIEMEEVKVEQAPGSMIIYKGCELRHQRGPLAIGRHFQLHFHYIDREMPWSKELLFDSRPGLGHPWGSRSVAIHEKWNILIEKVRNEATGEDNAQGDFKVDNIIQLMVEQVNNDRSS